MLQTLTHKGGEFSEFCIPGVDFVAVFCWVAVLNQQKAPSPVLYCTSRRVCMVPAILQCFITADLVRTVLWLMQQENSCKTVAFR